MDCQKIRKAAVCVWSDDDEAFTITTPECIQLAAHGDTEDEAWALFDEFLAAYYQDFKAGKFKPAKRMGRPKANRVRKNAYLSPKTVAKLEELKAIYGYNDGQAIDWVFDQVELPVIQA